MRQSVILAVCLLLICTGCGQQSTESSSSLFAMDAYINMTAYGPDPETALETAENRIQALERLWSVTAPDSDVYAVNHNSGEQIPVSKETQDAISFALHMA